MSGRKRKAQGLSINTIVIAALAVAVLLILFLVFRGQIGGLTNKYLGFGEKAVEGAEPGSETCESLFSDRYCAPQSESCTELRGYSGCPAAKPKCCRR